MRVTLVVVASAAAAACGTGGQQISRSDERGWAERMRDAEAHDRRAAEHEAAAQKAALAHNQTSYHCGDTVLSDQLTSGGQRVITSQPCFDIAEEAAVSHLDAALHEHAAASRDRKTAAALVRAEATACQGVPAAERDHSVFAHKQEIAAVIPHREAGQIRGVWVEFKRVPGLDANWIRRDIACQRARYAVLGAGHDHVVAGDPTLIPGSEVSVFDNGDRVEVLVRTANSIDGELAIARAEGRLEPTPPQTASRP